MDGSNSDPGGLYTNSHKTEKQQQPTSHSTFCQTSSKCSSLSSSFKPIRIDNWSGFLAQKLSAFFARGHFCDLELKFHSTDQRVLRVHSVVVHACTDFFKIQMEKQKRTDVLLMPDTLSYEPVSLLVQFMYSGRLPLGADNSETLLETARSLGVAMVAKLIENQRTQARLAEKLAIVAEKEQDQAAKPYRMTDVFTTSKDMSDKNENKDTDKVASSNVVARTSSESEKCPTNPSSISHCSKTVSKTPRRINPRTLPSTSQDQPLKKLTSSDVFLKYNSSSSTKANPQQDLTEATRLIAEHVRKHPELLANGRPVKVRLLLPSNSKDDISGQEGVKRRRTIVATVSAGANGRLRIVHRGRGFSSSGLRVQGIGCGLPMTLPAEGPWLCRVCRSKSDDSDNAHLVFDSYYGCRLHHARVHGRRFDPKTCEYCGLKFAKRLLLAHHKLTRHDVAPPPEFEFYRCPVSACEHVSMSRDALDRHQRRHQNDKDLNLCKEKQQIQGEDKSNGQAEEEFVNDEEEEEEGDQEELVEMEDAFDLTGAAAPSSKAPYWWSSPYVNNASAANNTFSLPNFQELTTSNNSQAQQDYVGTEALQILNVAVPMDCQTTGAPVATASPSQQQTFYILADPQHNLLADGLAPLPIEGFAGNGGGGEPSSNDQQQQLVVPDPPQVMLPQHDLILPTPGYGFSDFQHQQVVYASPLPMQQHQLHPQPFVSNTQ